MQKDYRLLKIFIIVILGINLQACGSIQQMIQGTPTFTPTITPTPTLTATATLTSTPTRTPTSTATPNLVATQKVEEFSELMKKYFDADFLATVDGQYYQLEDSNQVLAKKGYYQWTTYGVNVRNFILRTNVRMSTANKISASTGCGIVFRSVGNFVESIIFVQDGYVYYGAGKSNFNSRYYGKTDNSSTVQMVLILNEKKYEFYVDGKLALDGDSVIDPSKGDVGYAVQSGSNEDFGSQCSFTNTDLWAIIKK